MTKEEVIAQAYGEYWELVKDFVDSFGWFYYSKREDRFDDLFEDIETIDYFDYELELCFSRPKCLEFWEIITEYPDYHVSDLGRIKSIERKIRNGVNSSFVKPENILVPHKNKSGYLSVNLYKLTKKKIQRVHRLVGNAFLSNEENKKCLNHRNGDKVCNYLINLERNTHSENNKHAFRLGLKSVGTRAESPHSKLTEIQVSEIRMRKNENKKILAKEFNISYQVICSILRNHSWVDQSIIKPQPPLH